MAEETLTAEEEAYFASSGESALPDAENPAPEPEVKPVEEAKPTEEAKPAEPDDKKSTTVPFSALNEERERRREMARELQAEREARARLEERLSMFSQAQQMAQAKNAPQPPDPQTDPTGYIIWNQQQIQARQQQFEEYQRQQVQQTQAQQQQQQFLSTYAQQAEAFAATTPDFREAYSHLVNEYIAERMDAGYSKEQAIQDAQFAEGQIVSMAMQQGVNPAERIYALAKRRGYAKPQAAPAPAPVVDPMQTLRRGVESSKSLGAAAGTAPAGGLSLKDLSNLSDEEFEQATAGKKWGQMWA